MSYVEQVGTNDSRYVSQGFGDLAEVTIPLPQKHNLQNGT
jgi:hypothetical protein